MSKLAIPLTQLIHENLSIIATFAFSRRPLETLVQSKFEGSWKYLHKALFEISEQRATRACIDIAVFMRHLDDRENLTHIYKQLKPPPLGRVIKTGLPDEELHFRDLTNKILHASDLSWDFSDSENPLLICESADPARWLRAEVSVTALAAACGELMS
jgi:hypothetical protein